MKFAFCLCIIFISSSLNSQSDHIHVDQFGYLPNASKVAVISDPYFGQNSALSYSPADSLELREYVSNNLIKKYEPQEWQLGEIDTFFSGDKGWWIDFSEMQNTGSYYLTDPISLDTSPIFKVTSDVYDIALKESVRMFYYNRCNMSKESPFAEPKWIDVNNNFNNALQDYNCRYIDDPLNSALEKDLSGGWFDAGDYNKYTTFTLSTLHNLLWAYRSNPAAFGDNNNIPESGNGIPDLLDEIMWELDWLLKMTNADGSVHIKMGSQNYSENVGYPPSNNYDQRFYGPTCTSASLTVASVFAHASFVLKDFPSLTNYANNLKANAELAWSYLLPFYQSSTLEYDCDDGSIVSGAADFNTSDYEEGILAAAIYLFETTGHNSYNNFVINNYLNSSVFGDIPNVPGNISSYYDDWWDINHVEVKDAFLNYKNIVGHNPQVASDFFYSFQAMVNNDWEQFYGLSNDLYRAYLPSYFLGWGSSMSQSSMGNMNFNIVQYNADNSNSTTYYDKASAHLHFINGCNPLGKLFLSNMYGKGGDRCADEIYHTWFADGSIYDNALTSSNGPAPGFLSGGNNHFYSGPNSPPANEPMLKSYYDMNDVTSISWEITEPAIYYQAAYIRLLANVMSLDNSMTTNSNVSMTDFDIDIHPNPVDNFFIIKGELGLYNLDILNSNGQVVQNINSMNTEETINTELLGPGLYFIRIEKIGNNKLSVQKIIKHQ